MNKIKTKTKKMDKKIRIKNRDCFRRTKIIKVIRTKIKNKELQLNDEIEEGKTKLL